MTIDGRWEAAITVPAGVSISATNSGGGPTAVSITAGSYTGITALCAHVATRLNAVRTPANWTVSLSTGASGTGQVSINYVGTGTYSITWTSTELRDILGFSANLSAVTQGVASVGPKQARGLWLPDCPFVAATDPRAALRQTDRRTVSNPSGVAFSHVGNAMFRIRELAYAMVPKARVLEGAAIAGGGLANSSLETFWNETQLGLTSYSAWFSPASKCIVTDHTGLAIGSYGSIAGWYVADPKELPDLVDFNVPNWTGAYRVMIGDLTSDG